jgi:hypothetical protein
VNNHNEAIKQAISRKLRLRATVRGAMHSALDAGMEVADVADCLEALTNSLLNGNWLKEQP